MARSRLWTVCVAWLATSFSAASADAQSLYVSPTQIAAPREEQPVPRHHVTYRNLFAARANPLGVIEDFRIGYRYRLFEDLSPIARDAFAGVTGTFAMSPAWSRFGAALEFAPLSILQLSVQYEFVLHHGALGSLVSFSGDRAFFREPSPLATQPSTNVQAEGADAATQTPGKAYVTYGHVVSLNGALQVRIGPLVVRDTMRAMYQSINLRGTSRAYYDIYFDILAPGNGWLVTNDADIIAMVDHGRGAFLAGVRHSTVSATYADGQPGPRYWAYDGYGRSPNPDEPSAASSLTQRIGPVFGYQFFDKVGARFNQPTLLLLTQWWIQHPYRTSALGGISAWSAGVPFLALALSFRGDL